MYSEEDLKGILDEVPPDFQKESDEFWSYVEEKLAQIAQSIHAVYLIWGEETVDPRAAHIVSFLQANGVEAHRLEDKALVGEARAWYLMAQGSVGGIEEEFLQEVDRELGDVLRRMLDSSLKDTEVGVVFFEPACKLSLGDDVRVIKMSPFDPRDYLARHLALKRLNRE
jgi:hypothetical protein